MATATRNTGTHFRYDADDQRWHAKVRTTQLDADGESFKEFITTVVTLVELLAWLADLFDGLATGAGNTVAGHPTAGITVTMEPPP